MGDPRDAAPEIDPLVEQGLQAFRSGDLRSALRAWEKALAARVGDPRLAALVDYARNEVAGAGPTHFADDFDAGETTSPELSHETIERVLQAEQAVAAAEDDDWSQRPRRNTLVSNLPAVLAPITRPPDASDADDRDTDEISTVPDSTP